MQILINNKKHDFQKDTNLFEAIQSLNLQNQKGIAIAINNQVIPKQNWNTHKLNDQDDIIIITATQGG